MQDCSICQAPICQKLDNGYLVHGTCVDQSDGSEIKFHDNLEKGKCAICKKPLIIMLNRCNHVFCGSCFIHDFMRQDKSSKTYKCALCRSVTTSILPLSINQDQNQVLILKGKEFPVELFTDVSKLDQIVETYLEKTPKDKFCQLLGSLMQSHLQKV